MRRRGHGWSEMSRRRALGTAQSVRTPARKDANVGVRRYAIHSMWCPPPRMSVSMGWGVAGQRPSRPRVSLRSIPGRGCIADAAGTTRALRGGGARAVAAPRRASVPALSSAFPNVGRTATRRYGSCVARRFDDARVTSQDNDGAVPTETKTGVACGTP